MTRIMTASTETEIHVQITYVSQVRVNRKGTFESTTGRNLDNTPAKATALRKTLLLITARNKPLKMLDDRGRAIFALDRAADMESSGRDKYRYGSNNSAPVNTRIVSPQISFVNT